LERQEIARKKRDSPILAEMQYMRSLGPEATQQLWSDIRDNTKQLSQSASEVILGIKAETGVVGLSALRAWVSSLSLPRGILTSYNDMGTEISYEDMLHQPVYIKYNSTDSGNAYMKEYKGDSYGVIFQCLYNGDFVQVGDFPLKIFPSQP
jgi:hypothetical protein